MAGSGPSRRRLRSTSTGSQVESPSSRPRTGEADSPVQVASSSSEPDTSNMLEQMYDAQEGPDTADEDDSDFDPRTVVMLAAADDDDDEEEEYGSEWEEAMEGDDDDDEEEEDDEDDDEEDEEQAEVDPVMVRRAAATSRLFMQRILSQFAAVGGGDDHHEGEWEEASEDDETLPRRRRGRGGSGSRAACSSGPQKPLEADVAWEVSRDTSADCKRQPLDPAATAKVGTSPGGAQVRNVADLLLRRECNGMHTGHFTTAQRAHITAFRSLPMVPTQQVDSMASRVYTGRFSRSGDVYVAAFQHERKVRVYDPDRGWALRKDVHARNLRWTVTDTDISPDERFLIYSSITPDVHLVNLTVGGVASEANVTDIHEALHFHGGGPDEDNDPFDRHGGFGIWSVRWSADGREILAGTGDSSLYIYDLAEHKVVLRVPGHKDDVNAIAWADDSGNLMVSGSDDRMVKLWDRRTAEAAHGIAAGNFVGHLEGVTHIDAKGDGRHFISNGKDQTIKLWDMRKCHSQSAMTRGAASTRGLPRFQWDYRWMAYPGSRRNMMHPNDVSLMTYRGHAVLQTLIRAYFSPAASTGQRYIYSGSADGSIYVWDLISGQQVGKLAYHDEIVRDCSWHPTQPTLVTASFDGTVVRWDTQRSVDEDPAGKRGSSGRRRSVPPPRNDQMSDW